MKVPPSRAMQFVLLLLKTLVILNWAGFALCLAVLASSFTDFIGRNIAHDHPGAAIAPLLFAIRAAMAIGMLMVPFAHVILTRLRDMVETVQARDPFVAVNARRLTAIAWSLLALQILDLGFGLLSARSEGGLGWSFSLTGWIAVILLFVLARVFDHGTRMREELEGTV